MRAKRGHNQTFTDDYYEQCGYFDDPDYYYGDKGGRGAREEFYRDWAIYVNNDDDPIGDFLNQ